MILSNYRTCTCWVVLPALIAAAGVGACSEMGVDEETDSELSVGGPAREL